jgi:hypothetical protein
MASLDNLTSNGRQGMEMYAAASMMALLSQRNLTESLKTITFGVFQRAPLFINGAGHFDEQTSLKHECFATIHVQQD